MERLHILSVFAILMRMSLRHIIWLVILRLSPRESQRPRHTRQCRRHSWCGPVHGVRDLKRVVQNHIGDDGHTISCIDAREQLSGFRHRAPRVPWHCTLLETCFLKLAHLSPYRTLGRRRTAARRKRGCITFFPPTPDDYFSFHSKHRACIPSSAGD